MKSSFLFLILALVSSLFFFSCLGLEETQKSDKDTSTISEGNPEPVTLLVSIGGSSRAERFLGSYDQIEAITLDIERDLDSRMVIEGFPLTRQNSNTWSATIKVPPPPPPVSFIEE